MSYQPARGPRPPGAKPGPKPRQIFTPRPMTTPTCAACRSVLVAGACQKGHEQQGERGSAGERVGSAVFPLRVFGGNRGRRLA